MDVRRNVEEAVQELRPSVACDSQSVASRGPELLAFSYADFPVVTRPSARYCAWKFHLLREWVLHHELLPRNWVRTGPAATEQELSLAHTAEWIATVLHGPLSHTASRELGFEWSSGLYERGVRIVGCAIAAVQAALVNRLAFTLGGGAHHAFSDKGRGFCIFNDIVIAAREVLRQGRCRRVAVLDLDVPQGDGTAALTNGDDRIFAVSVHGAHNYPFRKERSDLDIALPDGADDAPFLATVNDALDAIEEQREIDLLIYIAGADPFERDCLGRLAVTAAGLAQRDELVIQRCFSRGIPIAVLMGGGYCNPIEETVELQLQTVAIGQRLWRRLHFARPSGGMAL